MHPVMTDVKLKVDVSNKTASLQHKEVTCIAK